MGDGTEGVSWWMGWVMVLKVCRGGRVMVLKVCGGGCDG